MDDSNNNENGAFGFQPRFTISERFGLPPGSMRSQPPGKSWNWFRNFFGWPWVQDLDKKP